MVFHEELPYRKTYIFLCIKFSQVGQNCEIKYWQKYTLSVKGLVY